MIEALHYDSRKDLILLPGNLWGPLGEQNIRFAFDPGAYRTIINTQVADALGYQATADSQKISTASIIGKEWGYTLIVERLSILSFEFPKYHIACFDLPETYDIDGLIGLDLISRFEITLRHRDHWIQFHLLD
ncbi:MAG: retropepsin-like domain-containing protein [Deltaproteobacteria bacterium]|nr:retropepsin-like domain-containing protein [Deltaproteobacteria bacterium]